MNFSQEKSIQALEPTDISQKLILIERCLLDLRIKKATRQDFKPHEFKKLKKERAQLLTLKNTI